MKGVGEKKRGGKAWLLLPVTEFDARGGGQHRRSLFEGFAFNDTIRNRKDIRRVFFDELSVMAHHDHEFRFGDGLYELKDEKGVLLIERPGRLIAKENVG